MCLWLRAYFHATRLFDRLPLGTGEKAHRFAETADFLVAAAKSAGTRPLKEWIDALTSYEMSRSPKDFASSKESPVSDE